MTLDQYKSYLDGLKKCMREYKKLKRLLFEDYIDHETAFNNLEDILDGLIMKKEEMLEEKQHDQGS
ncbi:MAG TPA: hypothetical protein VGW78_07670 [Candidatus Babeliales bacterium]|nr:hypothetical protein [Candidatus Babeliales bacterium]